MNQNTVPRKAPGAPTQAPDFESMDDKTLITPPYCSWEHALLASIRLWKRIYAIPLCVASKFKSINQFKWHIVDELDIDNILNNCPICHHDSYLRGMCNLCPTTDLCAANGLYNKIGKAVGDQDLSTFATLVDKFIKALEHKYEETKAKREANEVDDTLLSAKAYKPECSHASAIEGCIQERKRQKALKALEDTIKLWLQMASYSDNDYKKLICGWGVRQPSHILLVRIKDKAVAALKMGHTMLNHCPLCAVYAKSKRCPLASNTPTGYSPDYYECGKGCLRTDYKYRALDHLILDLDSQNPFSKFRANMAHFTSVLWRKYMELDPFRRDK